MSTTNHSTVSTTVDAYNAIRLSSFVTGEQLVNRARKAVDMPSWLADPESDCAKAARAIFAAVFAERAKAVDSAHSLSTPEPEPRSHWDTSPDNHAEANETNRAHWTASEWHLLELFGTTANVRDYLDWLISAEPAPVDTSAGLHAPYLPELWDAMSFCLNARSAFDKNRYYLYAVQNAWGELVAACHDNGPLLLWANDQIAVSLQLTA